MKRILSFTLCLTFLLAACGPAPAAPTATPTATVTLTASATLTPTAAPTETPTPEPLRLQESIGEGNQNILSNDPEILEQQLQTLADQAMLEAYGTDPSVVGENDSRVWTTGDGPEGNSEYPFNYMRIGYEQGALVAESIITNADGTTDTVFTILARQNEVEGANKTPMCLNLLVTPEMSARTGLTVDEIRAMLQDPKAYGKPLLYIPLARLPNYYDYLHPDKVAERKLLAEQPEFVQIAEILDAGRIDFLDSDGVIRQIDPAELAFNHPNHPDYPEWVAAFESRLTPLVDFKR